MGRYLGDSGDPSALHPSRWAGGGVWGAAGRSPSFFPRAQREHLGWLRTASPFMPVPPCKRLGRWAVVPGARGACTLRAGAGLQCGPRFCGSCLSQQAWVVALVCCCTGHNTTPSLGQAIWGCCVGSQGQLRGAVCISTPCPHLQPDGWNRRMWGRIGGGVRKEVWGPAGGRLGQGPLSGWSSVTPQSCPLQAPFSHL